MKECKISIPSKSDQDTPGKNITTDTVHVIYHDINSTEDAPDAINPDDNMDYNLLSFLPNYKKIKKKASKYNEVGRLIFI